MSNEPEATKIVPGVELPKDRPVNFTPSEIVYTRYTYNRTRPEGERVVPNPGSHVMHGADIDAFIAARVKGRPLPPADAVYRQAGDDPAQERPINIFVSEQCWLVIELDPWETWQFTPGAPGITTPTDHKDDNWGLMHVMSDGTIADGKGPTGDGCRLIYFGVNARRTNEHQRFICNIDLSGVGLTDLLVDPDIPNDGGRFPFPLDDDPSLEDA